MSETQLIEGNNQAERQVIQEPIVDRPIVLALKSPEPFKRMVNALATLTDEATLDIDTEALTVRTMDPSHIALIDIHWPSSAFERFDNENTKAIKVGIRVDELQNTLKEFDNKKDSLKITLNGSDCMMVLDNRSGTVVKLRTIETSASSTPLPKLNFNSAIRLDYTVFEKVVKSFRRYPNTSLS